MNSIGVKRTQVKTRAGELQLDDEGADAAADDSLLARWSHTPQVDLIALETNVGFAAGNNIAAERARITELEREVKRLSAVTESTAFALGALPADVRGVVSEAREHAWRARLAAAHATEAAAAHADALVWKNGAAYSGETVNRQPHGSGIMVFMEGAKEIARYAGEFVEGQRAGHGIATSRDGLVWTGAWKDDEACGHGLLEAPDGQRFEGEVAPDESGAPKQVRGWEWGAASAPMRKPQPHHALTPALPPPWASGG